MPYNISGENPAITRKMEACVNNLMSDPKFKPKNPKQDKKSACIAVCKASILKAEKVRKKVIEKLK